MALGPEIARSTIGALRIALLDPDAPRWFNLTLEGFWRSFLAPAMLAPFFLALVLFGGPSGQEAEAAADRSGVAALRILSYALGVLAFPLLMIPIARLLRLTDAYVSYIIMWNWSAIPQNAVMIPVSALVAFGLVTDRSAAMFSMAAVITILFYGYLVARAGLRCPPFTAVGVVMLDFVLSLLINAGARSLAV
jgi:hypothetical protein